MLFILSKLDSFKKAFWAPFKDLIIQASEKSKVRGYSYPENNFNKNIEAGCYRALVYHTNFNH